MTRVLVGAAVAWVALLAVHATGQTQTPQSGGPLPGITATEFSEFRLGLDDFTEVETAEEGLGPAYNGTSCAVCHNVPTIGGGGVILELRAGYRDSDGAHSGLNPAGDTLIHLLSTPAHACQVQMPDDVTASALALAMQTDKKKAAGRIRFVCVEAIGRTRLVELSAQQVADQL